MGEEAEKKDHPKKDGQNVKVEKKEEDEEIVLKVDMHCEACARKVARALKGFEGVSDVTADYKASRVVVKGKAADPLKLCQRLQKKSGKNVELVSPSPKQQQPRPEEQSKEQINNKDVQPPAVVTLVLKVRMHCEACAQALQKRIRKLKGVESVTTDVANDQVTVKGVLDPEKLVKDIYKKTGKQASVVKGEEKKVEEKKEEEKEEEDQKKQESKEGEDDDKKTEVKKSEYLPPKYYMDHAHYYGPQMFSDENPNACSVM